MCRDFQPCLAPRVLSLTAVLSFRARCGLCFPPTSLPTVMTGSGAGVAWGPSISFPMPRFGVTSPLAFSSLSCPSCVTASEPSKSHYEDQPGAWIYSGRHQIHMRSASWGPYVNSSPQPISLHLLLPLGRESASCFSHTWKGPVSPSGKWRSVKAAPLTAARSQRMRTHQSQHVSST